MRKSRALVLLLLCAGVLPAACYEAVKPSERIWGNPADSLDGLLPAYAHVIGLDKENSFDRNGSLTVKSEGRSEVVLFTIKDERLQLLENAITTYQARIKSEDLVGKAWIEMRLAFDELGTYQSTPRMPKLEGTRDWTLQETNFETKPGQKPSEVFLMLVIDGKGQVWIDDMKVLRTAVGG